MRTFLLLLTASTLTLAGCGGRGGTPADPGPAFNERAAQVADSWRATITGAHRQAWESQLIPLQALTVPPTNMTNPDVRHAFESGWYRTRAAVARQVPEPAALRLPDGKTVTVTLVSAAEALADMDKGDPPCVQAPAGAATPTTTDPGGSVGAPAQHSCVALTVKDVALGEVTVRTNRGVVAMPAWLFTVDELPAPIARVAVSGTHFAAPPANQSSAWEAAPVLAATKIQSADQRSVTFIVATSMCDKAPAGLLYETDDAVVVAASTTQMDGPCPGAAALIPVTVTLAKPLGARVILDAVSGQPRL